MSAADPDPGAPEPRPKLPPELRNVGLILLFFAIAAPSLLVIAVFTDELDRADLQRAEAARKARSVLVGLRHDDVRHRRLSAQLAGLYNGEPGQANAARALEPVLGAILDDKRVDAAEADRLSEVLLRISRSASGDAPGPMTIWLELGGATPEPVRPPPR